MCTSWRPLDNSLEMLLKCALLEAMVAGSLVPHGEAFIVLVKSVDVAPKYREILIGRSRKEERCRQGHYPVLGLQAVLNTVPLHCQGKLWTETRGNGEFVDGFEENHHTLTMSLLPPRISVSPFLYFRLALPFSFSPFT